ncbi:MAG: glycosyltransferase, partial [Acidiferrobacterales bacterium]
GRYFRKPVVVTARGTDINLVPRYALPRRMILWAAGRAAGIITVCQALKDALLELGVAEKKIVVLRNGVDPQVFHPIDRQAWRARLGLNEISLLSVGELIKRKGHDIAIKALQKLPRVRLLIAGDGVEEQALRSLARSLGVAGRVTFLGPVPHCELTNYYGAADALVLASSREGLANVLLEAMACGTPVIASNVWGTPELVHSPEAGVLMAERSPGALVQAYHALFANYPDHRATARYAQRFTWEETTRGQLSLFRRILQQRPAA